MSIGTMHLVLSIFTGIVVLGVVLEGAELVEEYRLHGWQRGWLKILPKLGFSLLILGLAGEWVFQSKIGQYDANRIAELSPRDLDAEQRAAIGDACKGFSGKTVTVVSMTGDAEGARLATQIMEALSEAGIRSKDGRASVTLFGPDFGLNMIGPSSELGLVNCLENAFRDIGYLSVVRHGYPRPMSADGTFVTISVGLKPIAY